MVINEKPIFNKCLIKLNSKKENGENNVVEKKLENKKTEIIPENTGLENEEIEVKENATTINTDNLVDKSTILENESDNVLIDQDEIIDDEEFVEPQPQKENNVKFKVEDKEIIEKPLEKNDDLEEIELNVNEEEPMRLKEPNEVYLDIYKAAREKAKKAKNEAIKAYLEAKKIKELYMLDVIDSSTDEEEEEEDEIFSEN